MRACPSFSRRKRTISTTSGSSSTTSIFAIVLRPPSALSLVAGLALSRRPRHLRRCLSRYCLDVRGQKPEVAPFRGGLQWPNAQASTRLALQNPHLRAHVHVYKTGMVGEIVLRIDTARLESPPQFVEGGCVRGRE